jgi:hypothetical protein
LTLQINKVTNGAVVQEQGGGYVTVTLTTNLGAVEARYYPASSGTSAAFWVGGAGRLGYTRAWLALSSLMYRPA